MGVLYHLGQYLYLSVFKKALLYYWVLGNFAIITDAVWRAFLDGRYKATIYQIGAGRENASVISRLDIVVVDRRFWQAHQLHIGTQWRCDWNWLRKGVCFWSIAKGLNRIPCGERLCIIKFVPLDFSGGTGVKLWYIFYILSTDSSRLPKVLLNDSLGNKSAGMQIMWLKMKSTVIHSHTMSTGCLPWMKLKDELSSLI